MKSIIFNVSLIILLILNYKFPSDNEDYINISVITALILFNFLIKSGIPYRHLLT